MKNPFGNRAGALPSGRTDARSCEGLHSNTGRRHTLSLVYTSGAPAHRTFYSAWPTLCVWPLAFGAQLELETRGLGNLKWGAFSRMPAASRARTYSGIEHRACHCARPRLRMRISGLRKTSRSVRQLFANDFCIFVTSHQRPVFGGWGGSGSPPSTSLLAVPTGLGGEHSPR